jgi:predicted small integral membrane protein
LAVNLALYGFYMLLVALGNLTDFDTNQEFVQRVLAMDTTNFGAEPGTNLDDDVMWRAITNETLQDVVYIGIIAWESATALVLLMTGVAWLRLRGRGHEAAMSLSTIGLLMALLLFFGGFIVIGGEWFQMWRSASWNGLEVAFRDSVLAMVGLVVIHLPVRHGAPERQ